MTLSVFISGPALAQFAFVSAPSGHMERSYQIDALVEQQFKTDIDGGGRFQRFRGGVGFGTQGAINRNIGLGLDTSFTYDGFDFDETIPAPCAPTVSCFEVPPWKSIYTIDIAPSTALIFNPGFQVIAWVPMRISTENSSDSNGFTGGVLIGARLVAFSERFETTLGFGYQSELEDSGRLFPLIAIRWHLTDNLELVTEGGPYEGGSAVLLWGPAETIKLRVSGGWERNRFRLSKKGTRNPSGIGEHETAPLLAGMQIELTKGLSFEVHGGVAVAGRLRIEDANGQLRKSQGYGAAGRLGGSFKGVF